MMPQPQVEELSDTNGDPDDMDPVDFDPKESIISPSLIPSSSVTRNNNLSNVRSPLGEDPELSKDWQCLYPVYFDASRSRVEGRRVGKKQAVHNPLAREIVDAVQALGLKVMFEPGKIHPKDWSNPGRVRVAVKEQEKRKHGYVKNKHHLYRLVAEYLQAHPTTEKSPLRLPIAGLPTPSKPNPPPAVPRGWKINSILPLHSAALSGGGISENFIKDMMAEMQGQGESGSAANSTVGDSKKKRNKKGK